MLQQTGIVYKLTFLYILHKANCPVTNVFISNFLLESDYTDYFNIQQLIGELLDDGYIAKDEYHGKTLYSITDSGETALKLLTRELSSGMKADVDKYLTDHNMQLYDDIAVRSKYYRNDIDHFVANLFIEEAGEKLLELNVQTASEDEAIRLCNKWPQSSSRLYPMIMTELMK